MDGGVYLVRGQEHVFNCHDGIQVGGPAVCLDVPGHHNLSQVGLGVTVDAEDFLFVILAEDAGDVKDGGGFAGAAFVGVDSDGLHGVFLSVEFVHGEQNFETILCIMLAAERSACGGQKIGREKMLRRA